MIQNDTIERSAHNEHTENDQRVCLAAMSHAKNVMSEYLNLSVQWILSWLVHTLSIVCNMKELKMGKKTFKFEKETQVAHHNSYNNKEF